MSQGVPFRTHAAETPNAEHAHPADDAVINEHLARSRQGLRHALACDGAADAHDHLATGRGPPGRKLTHRDAP